MPTPTPTIIVTGRDSQVSSTNKVHAEDKIAKLERYFDGIQKIEAVLGHSGDRADVELVISVRRSKPIVCHSHAKDLYAAIDLVIDKAEVQLTKLKERVKAHKGKNAGEVSAEAAARPGDDERLESYDEVIENTDFGPGSERTGFGRHTGGAVWEGQYRGAKRVVPGRVKPGREPRRTLVPDRSIRRPASEASSAKYVSPGGRDLRRGRSAPPS